MSIVRKVRAVERIFAALDKEIAAFQQASRLQCLAGCGFCCKKPDIEATVLEFLPLAYSLFIRDKGEETWLSLKNNQDPVCWVFRPGIEQDAGFCSQYAERGLICRLFGFSARHDKYGVPELSTCRKIKEVQPQVYIEAYLSIKKGMPVPVISDYYKRLYKVDFELARETYPVNVAIRKAIEVVMSHYAYRRKPYKKKQGPHDMGTIPRPGLSQDLISGPQ